MDHPPRVSSLDDKPPMYRFGNSHLSPTQHSYTAANIPRITFEDHDSDSSHDGYNEKAGFNTPESDSGRPLAYSYPPKPSHLVRPANYVPPRRGAGSNLGTGEEDDDCCPQECREIMASRAFKRWALVYAVGVLIFWTWWFRWHAPAQRKIVASTFLSDSLRGRFLDESEFGYFGTNRRVEFSGMQHMEMLDRALVPGSETPGASNRRLIVIGDIHGCAVELTQLLKEVAFDSSKDYIVTTGDMVSHGPASSEVLDILLQNNASCVRGNNEDRILHAYRDHHAPSHQKVLAADTPNSGPSTVALKHGHSSDLALAASLSPKQISYLSSCPLIINLGAIAGMGANTSIVHAGLIPGVALEKQDPSAVMTMRSIDLRNQVPSPHHPPDPAKGPPPRPRSRLKKPDYTNWDDQGRLAVLPWGPIWDEFQEMVPALLQEGRDRERNPPPPPPPTPVEYNRRNPLRRGGKNGNRRPNPPINPFKDLAQTSVIHGHDPSLGVVEGKWHYALDGNCIRGGVLAAMVLEETDNFLSSLSGKHVKKSIITVPCQWYVADEEPPKEEAKPEVKEAPQNTNAGSGRH